MRAIWLRLLLVLAFASVSFQAFAQASPGRYASKAEIAGFWKVGWGATLPGFPNPYPSPHQWWGFLEDGTVVSVHSNQPLDMNASKFAELAKQSASTVRWEFREGFIRITRTDHPSVELWGVNVWQVDQEFMPGAKISKGDILMSLDNGQGKIRYYRRITRLQ